MNNNKKKIFIITGISLLVLIAIIGGTYAWYVWSTSDNEVTKIVAGVGAATVTFDGGSDISANLKPVADKSNGIVKTIKVKASTTGLNFNMYLDIASIDTGLKDASFRYEFYRGTTKVKEGNFSDTYLNSNTTTCSTNSTKHITLVNGDSISTTTTDYTLYIWIDGANYENPSTMMDKTFSFKLHAEGEGAILYKPTAAATIIDLYTNASKTMVTNNSITYNIAPSVSLMNDRLGSTSIDVDGGNIRYYGANPSNYIYFNCETYPSTNCELWRIIGVFDGKVKIIRDELIGDIPYDDDDEDTYLKMLSLNDSNTFAVTMEYNIPYSKSEFLAVPNPTKGSGDNDYSTSSLQKILNNYYYNGVNYSGKNSYTFTNIGIKNDVTRNMISNSIWNLGGFDSNSTYSNQIYNYERGTTVYSGNSTIWTGKIGLIYPSDYSYAADLNKCTKQLNNYSDSTCTANDWLFDGISQWTLTPYSSTKSYAWHIYSSGHLDNFLYTLYGGTGVRPALYLNSELEIKSGDGSSSNPYTLSV